MKKIKTARVFTFKAYAIDIDDLNNINTLVNNIKSDNSDAHIGQFIFKSDCHYYCEKNVLDAFNANIELNKFKLYLIYKISTEEDSAVKDCLIELIYFKDDKINII